MTERTLTALLEQQLTESDSSQFEVGEQRERNHRYYTMQPLGNEIRGRSHYISPDVLDSVENKKALFKETFLRGRQLVKFRKQGKQTPDEADSKTAYTEIMLGKNDKDRLFRDGWHDAFVAKRMAVLIEWREETRKVQYNLNPVNQMQMQMLIANEGQGTQIVGVDTSEMVPVGAGTFAGPITIELDDSYTHIELMQPERYYRDPQAAYPEYAMWNTYEEDTSRATLIDRGYEPESVENLSQDYRFRSEEEDSSRKSHDRSWTRRRQHNRDDVQGLVTMYRTWTWLDMYDENEDIAEEIEAPEGIALYEIHWSQGEILKWADGTLAITVADDCPFFEWTEYKISHAENGMADADITAQTQKSQSTLKRLIIDNQQMRNSSRYEAKVNSLKNPRDLLDNNIGGVIWSKDGQSVNPLATPELSPLTFQVLAMGDRDGDKRSGMSDAAKGMNTDVIRYQNAESLVDKVMAAGGRRPASAASDFAQTFLVPISRFIVKLGMKFDKSTRQYEVGGKVINVAPSQWIDHELNMAVAKALTPEEGQKYAQNLLLMHQIMKDDAELAKLYQTQQKHALMDDAFDAMGVEDTTRYMTRPDDPGLLQQNQQEQQMMMQERQKQDQIIGTQIKNMISTDELNWAKFDWDRTNDMADNNREDEQLEHQMLMDESELKLEKTQKRNVSIN